MIVFVKSALRAISLSVVLLSGVVPGTAHAVNISVGGVIYDVELTAVSLQYLDVRADALLTPWWGSQTLAEEAAANFHAATGGDYGVTAGGADVAFFVYFESGAEPTDIFLFVYHYENGAGPLTTSAVNNAFVTADQAFAVLAAAGPAAVPEIDGNALFKALFCLFTLGAWLRARRTGNAMA